MDDGSEPSMTASSSPGQRLAGLFIVALSSSFFAAAAGVARTGGGPPLLFLVPFLAVPSLFLILGLFLLLSTSEVAVDRASQEVRLTTRVPLLTLSDERVPFGDVERVVVERRVRATSKGGRYEAWEVLLRGRSKKDVRAGERSSEAAARALAESLAKGTGRPLEDRCATPPVVREPSELDVPVAHRLRREEAPRLYELPAGHPVSESRTPEGSVFAWSARQAVVGAFLVLFSGVWLAGSLAGALPALGLALLKGDAVLVLFALFLTPFVAAGLAGLGAGLFLLAGRRELVVAPRSVSLTSRLRVPVRTVTVPADAVEEVRVAERLACPTVELVSDERILSLDGVGDLEQARALQARLLTLLVHGR